MGGVWKEWRAATEGMNSNAEAEIITIPAVVWKQMQSPTYSLKTEQWLLIDKHDKVCGELEIYKERVEHTQSSKTRHLYNNMRKEG